MALNSKSLFLNYFYIIFYEIDQDVLFFLCSPPNGFVHVYVNPLY
jgi:hypothetical protein